MVFLLNSTNCDACTFHQKSQEEMKERWAKVPLLDCWSVSFFLSKWWNKSIVERKKVFSHKKIGRISPLW
jgi:hypothetical protein